MTGPIRPEGEAIIEVHASADEPTLEREMRPAVQGAAEAVESDMDKAGDDWGKTAGKSLGDRLEKEAPTIFQRFSRIFSRQKAKIKADVSVDADTHLLRREMTEVISDAFDRAEVPRGFLDRLSSGFSDAIGAGFNVSGRSPLIALLVPVIGAIVALVIGAVQAVSALVTLLAALPVLIGGIAAQIGVVAIAFQGVGTAIQGAFAAKNAKELNEAIKGLTPSAQAFVRELLPLRKLFQDIRAVVQESFFKEIRGDITAISKALGPLIKNGLKDVATEVGNVFHLIAGFLSSPLFQDFIADVTGSTVEFLKIFGPGLVRFLDGLTRLAIAATPLLDDFGKQLGMFLANVGRVFGDIADDPRFQGFLEDMGDTFFNLFRLVDSLSLALVALGGAINTAGGNEVLKAIVEVLDQLAFFLASPLGQEGLAALIDMSIFFLKVTVGLLEAVLTILAVLRNAPEAIGAFFDWVGGKILDAVHAIGGWFSSLGDKVAEVGRGIKDWIMSIPHLVGQAFKDAGTFLFTAGRNILQGLIDGIKSKLSPLTNLLGSIAQTVRNYWPFSPAKTGPLSGSGDMRIAGQKLVQRLGEGMHMEIPSLRSTSENVANNIVFGAGAIQQNFNGVPTRTQAVGVGQGVANGIQDGLINRDTRLAVRTL